jgi:shikimate dehydrogenase
MGARGVATRLLGLGRNLFTYASLEGKGTAEGQPTLHDLRHVYNARRTDPHGPVYGVVGDPANHSRGPALHNRLLRDHGLDGVYVPFELDRPEPLWDAAEELSLRGLSVTMPFKEPAARRADRADEFTRRTGAANTLAFRKDGVHGANTDGPAVIEALENARGSVAGRQALVIGAGGAARSAALALALAQAVVTVTNRSVEPGERLAAETKGSFLPLDRADPGLFDVVVQATPVGMHPKVDAQPLPGARVRKGALVLEMIYHPRTTRFLAAARLAGALGVDGLEVFSRQAREQFAFWTGKRPDLAIVEAALAEGEEAGA